MPDLKKQRQEAAALLKEVLARLEREGIRELSVTKGDLRVRVRRGAERIARATAASADGDTPQLPGPAGADGEAGQSESGVLEVKAPLTGVFYRAPSPQATPYVQVGSTVSVGQVIGLIEAMKLFNEIRSTAAGRVRRILADTGQLVRAHTPLIEVEPL